MVDMIHQPLKIIGNIGAEYREMDSDRIYRAVMMAAENLHSFRWEDSYQRYAFAELLFEQRIPISNYYLAYLQHFNQREAFSESSEIVRYAKARSLYQIETTWQTNSRMSPCTKDITVYSFIITLAEQLRNLCKLGCSPPREYNQNYQCFYF